VGVQVDGVTPESAGARVDPGGPGHIGARVKSTATLSGLHGGRESKPQASPKTASNRPVAVSRRKDRCSGWGSRGSIWEIEGTTRGAIEPPLVAGSAPDRGPPRLRAGGLGVLASPRQQLRLKYRARSDD
jgi:hypothetical protein